MNLYGGGALFDFSFACARRRSRIWRKRIASAAAGSASPRRHRIRCSRTAVRVCSLVELSCRANQVPAAAATGWPGRHSCTSRSDTYRQRVAQALACWSAATSTQPTPFGDRKHPRRRRPQAPHRSPTAAAFAACVRPQRPTGAPNATWEVARVTTPAPVIVTTHGDQRPARSPRRARRRRWPTFWHRMPEKTPVMAARDPRRWSAHGSAVAAVEGYVQRRSRGSTPVAALPKAVARLRCAAASSLGFLLSDADQAVRHQECAAISSRLPMTCGRARASARYRRR